jgi:hypothetical protein
VGISGLISYALNIDETIECLVFEVCADGQVIVSGLYVGWEAIFWVRDWGRHVCDGGTSTPRVD